MKFELLYDDELEEIIGGFNEPNSNSGVILERTPILNPAGKVVDRISVL